MFVTEVDPAVEIVAREWAKENSFHTQPILTPVKREEWINHNWHFFKHAAEDLVIRVFKTRGIGSTKPTEN